MLPNSLSVSLQGNERKYNQDFAISCVVKGREFWLIADGATNAKNSGEFMSSFGNKLMQQWTNNDTPVDEASIRELIIKVHSQIQRDFICAKGSFLLLIVEPTEGRQHCFYMGDCRVGIAHNGNVYWQNYPHSLIHAKGEINEARLCEDPYRHTLFKVLKGKRLENPEYKCFQLDLANPLILATDGYWNNYPAKLPTTLTESTIHNNLKDLNCSDDATVLIRLTH